MQDLKEYKQKICTHKGCEMSVTGTQSVEGGTVRETWDWVKTAHWAHTPPLTTHNYAMKTC